MGDLLIRTRLSQAIFLAVLGLSVSGGPVRGQSVDAGPGGSYSMAVRGVDVAAALDQLVHLTGINLVYSSDVVAGRVTVCRAEKATAEALLRCIVEGARLDFYRMSSGTYVVIEGPQGAPAYGTVAGRVVDGVTGDPVPFAALEWSKGRDRIMANESGSFVLPRLLPGELELSVSGMGYRPSHLSLDVPASAAIRREIVLSPSVVELDPIFVDGLEGRPAPARGSVAWHSEGGLGPVPRQGDVTVQARTGLGVARRPYLADLSIQGSAPGEHMTRLDGVPVFDPVSLGRTRSAFSPLALRRITVRKSGFGAAHGSFTGGVIDIDQRTSGPRGRASASLLVDPYSFDGDASFPLSMLGGEGSVMIAGRSSLWNVFEEPTLNTALRDWNRVDPVLMRQIVGDGQDFTDALGFSAFDHASDFDFGDLHGAMRLRLPGFKTLDASFYRGTNQVGTRLVSGATYYDDPTGDVNPIPSESDGLSVSRDHYDWSNMAGRVGFDWLIGDRAAAGVGIRGSRHTLDHSFGMASELDVGSMPGASPEEIVRALSTQVQDDSLATDGNRIEEWAVDATGDVTLGAGHRLQFGAEGVFARSETHMLNPYFRPLEARVEQWRWSGFAADTWRLGDRVTLHGGLRLTHAGTGRIYSEPRLSFRWDQQTGPLGPWSVELGAGRYHQFVNQFEVTNVGPSAVVPDVRFWLPYDGTVAPPEARHLSAEFVATPRPGLELRAEAYHKWLDRLLELDYGVLMDGDMTLTEMDQGDFVGLASGVAYGAGASATWESARHRLRGSYDWTYSERTFPSRFEGRPQPVPWLQPHRVELAARVPVSWGLSLEAESQSIWGRPWGLRRAYYDFLFFHGAPDGPQIDLPEDDVLPALHQLDLGVSWLGRIGGALSEVRAEVRNLFGDRNVMDRSLQRTDQTEPGVDAQGDPVSHSLYREIDRFLPGPGFFLTIRVGF